MWSPLAATRAMLTADLIFGLEAIRRGWSRHWGQAWSCQAPVSWSLSFFRCGKVVFLIKGQGLLLAAQRAQGDLRAHGFSYCPHFIAFLYLMVFPATVRALTLSQTPAMGIDLSPLQPCQPCNQILNWYLAVCPVATRNEGLFKYWYGGIPALVLSPESTAGWP